MIKFAVVSWNFIWITQQTSVPILFQFEDVTYEIPNETTSKTHGNIKNNSHMYLNILFYDNKFGVVIWNFIWITQQTSVEVLFSRR